MIFLALFFLQMIYFFSYKKSPLEEELFFLFKIPKQFKHTLTLFNV